jgi:S1-C subfamily serine protease
MEGVIELHRSGESTRPSIEGKQVKPSSYRTPLDYPSLAGRYRTGLNYEDKVAESCVHCHQIREAERLVYRSEGKPLPDSVLYPYPDPSVLGLKLNPHTRARIERVSRGSAAERAGLRAGDAIASLEGQPLLSTADLQWVLHNAPDKASLRACIERAGKRQEVTLSLPPGWRRGNISWRPTTWDLRRMGLGGLLLEPVSPAERAETNLPKDTLALSVRWAGEHGAHGTAKRAGIERGDIIVGFDNLTGNHSESDLLAYAVQRKRPGEKVSLTFLRKGQTHRATFELQ